jgi:hypothetical protein
VPRLLTHEECFGLYLNLERGTVRRAEAVRLGVACSRGTPPQWWFDALHETPEAAEEAWMAERKQETLARAAADIAAGRLPYGG